MKLNLFYLLLFLSFTVKAQQGNGDIFKTQPQFRIAKTTEPIKIDGILDEPVWAVTPMADSFLLKYPTDVGRPQRKTEVKMTHDDKFIYFGFTAYDSGKSFIQTLKRDNGHDGNDCVAIILDPTNQRTNGFFFVVNAFNAQSEDQLPWTMEAPGAGIINGTAPLKDTKINGRLK